MKSKESVKSVIIKTIVFLVFLMLDFFMMLFAFLVFAEVKEEKDITYAVRDLEEEYYEKDYTSLIDDIKLYDFYAEDVKVYKEIGDAYVLKMSCTILADSNDMAEYREKFDELSQMLENCEPQNKKIISDFIEEVRVE